MAGSRVLHRVTILCRRSCAGAAVKPATAASLPPPPRRHAARLGAAAGRRRTSPLWLRLRATAAGQRSAAARRRRGDSAAGAVAARVGSRGAGGAGTPRPGPAAGAGCGGLRQRGGARRAAGQPLQARTAAGVPKQVRVCMAARPGRPVLLRARCAAHAAHSLDHPPPAPIRTPAARCSACAWRAARPCRTPAWSSCCARPLGCGTSTCLAARAAGSAGQARASCATARRRGCRRAA